MANGPNPEVVELDELDAAVPADGVAEAANDDGPEKVSLASEAEKLGGDVTETPPLARLGFHLTIAIVALIVFVFFWVGVYAWLTFPPSLDDLDNRFTTDAEAAAKTYTDMRTAWSSGVKDLLQILVVSLLIPLLATVIGYIFGKSEKQEET